MSDAHWHNVYSKKCFSGSKGEKGDTMHKLLAQLFVDGFVNLYEDIAVSFSIVLMEML